MMRLRYMVFYNNASSKWQVIYRVPGLDYWSTYISDVATENRAQIVAAALNKEQ